MLTMADEMDLDELFTCATKHVRHLSRQLTPDKLLSFYARFKQVTEGPCRTPKPSFFDFQGKAKWDSWNKLGDMPKEQAMLEYVSFLNNIDEQWMDRLSLVREQTILLKLFSQEVIQSQNCEEPSRQRGLGVSVSIMANPDTQLSDVDKTVFDWCQEGKVDQVRQLLVSGSAEVDSLDQEGLGLLHWSCDRGDIEMTKMLLSMGADINKQASDLQTALHYAVSCDHKDVTELLLQQGINITLKDDDGHTAMDVASDDMKLFLQGQMSFNFSSLISLWSK